MQHHELDVASVRKEFVGPSLSMESVATAASLLEHTAKAQLSHGQTQLGLKTVKTHWCLKTFLKGETPQAAEAAGCPMSQQRKQEQQLGESTRGGQSPTLTWHQLTLDSRCISPQKRQMEHSFSHLIASYQAGISILMN